MLFLKAVAIEDKSALMHTDNKSPGVYGRYIFHSNPEIQKSLHSPTKEGLTTVNIKAFGSKIGLARFRLFIITFSLLIY